MHFPETHRHFTKSLFNWLPTNTIDRVNSTIDNPSIWQLGMNRMVHDQYKNQGYKQNPFDVFGLANQGHRTKNHDMLTGLISSYATAGTPGIYAMMGHYMADQF